MRGLGDGLSDGLNGALDRAIRVRDGLRVSARPGGVSLPIKAAPSEWGGKRFSLRTIGLSMGCSSQRGGGPGGFRLPVCMPCCDVLPEAQSSLLVEPYGVAVNGGVVDECMTYQISVGHEAPMTRSGERNGVGIDAVNGDGICRLQCAGGFCLTASALRLRRCVQIRANALTAFAAQGDGDAQ